MCRFWNKIFYLKLFIIYHFDNQIKWFSKLKISSWNLFSNWMNRMNISLCFEWIYFFNIISFCFVKLNFVFNFSYFHTSQNNNMKWRCEKPENFNLLSFLFRLKRFILKCVWQGEEFQHFLKKTLFQWNLFMKKSFFI